MAVNKDNIEQLWHDWFTLDASSVEKRLFHTLRLLPQDPRCKLCHAPFEGMGGVIMRTLYSKKQSTLNPHFCNVCENFAKMYPGGAEVEMSMLFVDVRGSTALSEQMNVTEFRDLINRFFVESTRAIVR